jgi:hypothetical protein
LLLLLLLLLLLRLLRLPLMGWCAHTLFVHVACT